MASPMPPMPDRNAPPANGGQGLLDQQPPAVEQQPDSDLSGKLQLFRSADEAVMAVARAVGELPEIEQIKQLLKQAMMKMVASQRTTNSDNPRILGA